MNLFKNLIVFQKLLTFEGEWNELYDSIIGIALWAVTGIALTCLAFLVVKIAIIGWKYVSSGGDEQTKIECKEDAKSLIKGLIISASASSLGLVIIKIIRGKFGF